MLNGGRKSIKKEEIEEVGHPISLGLHPRIDYIQTVKKIFYNLSFTLLNQYLV